jgi:hypothetical protein
MIMKDKNQLSVAFVIGLVASVFASSIVACEPSSDTTRLKKKDNNNTSKGEGEPEVITCTDFGSGYAGFMGTKLEEGRVKSNIGTDRARIKPYSALRAEYERVLGVAPSELDKAAASFGGGASPRYSAEPRASAIQVYAAFRLAFDGCLSYVANNPELASQEPSKENASAECTSMARAFWSRKPTAEEVSACAEVAVTDSQSEGTADRRWAYTCASLLTSAGFLSY